MSPKNNFGKAYFMPKNWIRSPNSQSHKTSPGFQTGLCVTEINTFHTKHGAIELGQFGLGFILQVFILQVEHKAEALKTLKVQLHSWYKGI